jgi:hypothetical protein
VLTTGDPVGGPRREHHVPHIGIQHQRFPQSFGRSPGADTALVLAQAGDTIKPPITSWLALNRPNRDMAPTATNRNWCR